MERRLREANTLIRLYEFQRDEARRKVDVAEYCVGEVRARLQSNGIPIYRLHSVSVPAGCTHEFLHTPVRILSTQYI